MKRVITIVLLILGVVLVSTGSYAYFRNVINGSINADTGNYVFNVTGFDNEVTKLISLSEENDVIMPGDSGTFSLTLNATGSNTDVYCTLNIERTNLPNNLKFYTTSDFKSELHTYYSFLETSSQTETIPIYWYWDGTIDDANDTLFMDQLLSANITVDAVQMDYGQMKNGVAMVYDAEYDEWYPDYAVSTTFWNENYYQTIRSVTFLNDLSNMPSTCNEANLCWDISEVGSKYPVYAYMIDSGIDGLVGYDEELSAYITGDLNNLYIVSAKTIFAPTNCSYIFWLPYVESINFNGNFNTSKVTNMGGMFECSITSLDLSGFNTGNVTDMSEMFSYCWNLTSLDVSRFNTSKVTDMYGMFQECSSLTSLNLSNFNTSGVTYMGMMFGGCSSLTSLDLSGFNTGNVTDISKMFHMCLILTDLDLSSFNTNNVTNMSYMFYACSSLTSLDLSGFNTGNVNDMDYMFCNCSSLTSLNIINFDFSNVATMPAMFGWCYKLSTTVNMNGVSIINYKQMFYEAATDASALITVNYTTETSTLADEMIATKSIDSNVVKGSLIS